MENVFKIENSGPPVRKLIDGEEVMYKMREILPPSEETEWYENTAPKEIMEMVDELYNIVQYQPTIEAQEVKYGKWEQVDDTKCRCSSCKKVFLIAVYPNGGDKNYCPNCGARMDKG